MNEPLNRSVTTGTRDRGDDARADMLAATRPSSSTTAKSGNPSRPPSRWRVVIVYALAAATIVAVPATGAKKNKRAKSKQTTIELTTNVREAKVLASPTFFRLGSFDSKRPKLGELTVECKGAKAPACRITSSVAGPLRLKNGGVMTATPTASAGKGKNRTPGGVGGGGGGGAGGGSKGTKAPDATAAPPSSSASSAPPNTGAWDIDVDWNPCFFDGSLCFEISYDMGGDGFMALPDGSGDTVDGQQGDINIGGGTGRPGL